MRLALTISLLTLCAFAGKSQADALDLPASGETRTAPAAGDSLMLGAGVAYVPEYAGADKRRVIALPFLERTYDNGFFISTLRGAGYQTTLGDFNLSAALSYGGGRKDHRSTFSGSDALRGMGDIESGAQAIVGISYKLGGVGLSLSTTQSLSHRDNGATYTLGASMPLYTSALDQVSLGASAVYGDDDHVQTYFGVTEAQHARSRFIGYTARSGFETAGVTVNWHHVIDKNWSVRSAVGVTKMLNDADASPLTSRSVTPTLMTGFIYKF